MHTRSTAFVVASGLLALSACHSVERRSSAQRLAPAVSARGPAAVSERARQLRRKAPVREGGAVVRAARGETLYVADEDHGAVRIIDLPAGETPPREVRMPGAPAQLLALDGRILVTIRDPGLLLLMRPDSAAGLVETARIALPADAWAVAVTPDETTALVSSAWTNKVSAVDLDAALVRWTVSVAREPRAIVVTPDGTNAYVTHLVGRELTRIDAIDAAPSVHRVDLPPAPASAPITGHPDAFTLDASLAYSAVLSPAGDRLFVARHALGAYGRAPWFGRPVVDILLTADESPLAPARTHAGMMRDAKAWYLPDSTISADGQVPLIQNLPFTQPRAIAYRQSTSTLLVASEGSDLLAELDARSLDPAIQALRRYDLGGPLDEDKPGATRCGAPSGIALSAGESEAYVYCRSTGDLAVVTLDPYREGQSFEPPPPRIVHLSGDPSLDAVALGRRLFYNGTDPIMSQSLGCAGCHPEGREDGHVWQEHSDWSTFLTAGPIQDHFLTTVRKGKRVGFPRQTPMLVRRVAARGPYGWHGEAKTLEQRIMFGFERHGWGGRWLDLGRAVPRANALATFVREGLVAPPQEDRELTDEEQRGHEVFMSSETRCATCHFSATDYTDRSVVKLGRAAPVESALFAPEPNRRDFKTPSLLFIGRTAPYFHDGSAGTLEELVEKNHDRMGRTDHLSVEDRAALVAYLKTIGIVSGEPGPGARAEFQALSVLPVHVSFEAVPIADAIQNPLRDTSSLVTDPPAPEPSVQPAKTEWETAALVELPHQPDTCRIHRIREWVRIRCKLRAEDRPLAQVTFISGPRDGVGISEKNGEGEVVFPVRRGDRRLFELDELVFAWKSAVVVGAAIVISESWLPGQPAPVLTVTYEARSGKSKAQLEDVL